MGQEPQKAPGRKDLILGRAWGWFRREWLACLAGACILLGVVVAVEGAVLGSDGDRMALAVALLPAKRKSLKLLTGTVGWRKQPDTVTVRRGATEADVVMSLKLHLPGLVRVREEINKRAAADGLSGALGPVLAFILTHLAPLSHSANPLAPPPHALTPATCAT